MIEQAKESLREQGEPFDENVPVGGMIEIPAAVLAMGGSSTGSTSCRSAPTTSSSTRWRSTAPTRRCRICTTRCTRRSSAARARDRRREQGEGPDRGVRRDGGRGRDDAPAAGLGLRDYSMHPAHVPTVKQRVLSSDVATIKPLSSASSAPTRPRSSPR
jgi:phosphotransferase system enzyme I (PtsI)